MLRSIHIRNFILIEKLELDFNERFSVITGNTGSGKSILLSAILFCFGNKIYGDPLRPNTDSCSVTLTFSDLDVSTKELLDDSGIEDYNDDDLIVKRLHYPNGRKKFLINDQVVTLKLLQKLFWKLIEFHGQHNHTLLTDHLTHIELLDQYGKYLLLKNEVADAYRNWQKLESELNDIQKERENIENEIDYLSHISKELEEADIKIAEEQELSDIKRQLQNREKEIDIIKSVLSEIDSGSIEKIIARSQRAISDLDHQSLGKVNSDLELAYDKIEDSKSTLNQLLQEITGNDQSIEEIDDRLYQIRSLARKHSLAPDELIDFLVQSKEKLESLSAKIANSADLEKEVQKYKELYLEKAKLLSSKRIFAAKNLEQKVMKELSSLEMKKAVFKIDIESNDDHATKSGTDHIRFVASTNPGMTLSPIDKIASGGELSRFMLALRVSLFNDAQKQTIIFDEIDVGLGGVVADSIGQRLKVLGDAVQTIAITHQPQVASWAQHHILLEKEQSKSRTKISAKALCDEEKALELARMISGRNITETGLKAAKELMLEQ